MLLHTRPGPDGLCNGSTGTEVAVDGYGMKVAFDDAGQVSLDKA